MSLFNDSPWPPSDDVPMHVRHTSVDTLTAQQYPAPPGYPAASELFEMEGYVMESLELLATAPISQYYGPEHVCSERDPRSRSGNRSPQSDGGPRYCIWQQHSDIPFCQAAPPNAVPTPWDKRSSFQQVHHRTIESQEQQQPCFTLSSSSSSQSRSGSVPIYTQFNHYHNNTLPPQPSSLDCNDSQAKPEEPSLKRQRNNAASSRFRAKKKRNEERMLQTARENEETLRRLENRVAELETENRWLKDLLIDKSEAAARKDTRATADERKGCEHKDGVGTGDVCSE